MSDMNDVCRKVKLSVVLVLAFKKNLFSSVAAAQKDVKTVITKTGSYLDLGFFSIQLSRSDNLDHLNLDNAKVNEQNPGARSEVDERGHSRIGAGARRHNSVL